ncbi:MAG: hypothetical protein P8J51_02305 [Dehalococcoidia bacterium]|nr:hypothetical protein [Dehalococcoidia bacterium]
MSDVNTDDDLSTQLTNNSNCDNDCQDLQPRWSGSDGVDNIDKAIGFVCHRCHKEYSPLAAKKYLQGNRVEPDPEPDPAPEPELDTIEK